MNADNIAPICRLCGRGVILPVRLRFAPGSQLTDHRSHFTPAPTPSPDDVCVCIKCIRGVKRIPFGELPTEIEIPF